VEGGKVASEGGEGLGSGRSHFSGLLGSIPRSTTIELMVEEVARKEKLGGVVDIA
jgi:hypothetical protein